MDTCRRAAVVALMFGVAFTVNARRVEGCECVGVPPNVYLESADIVYVGRVVDIRTDPQRFAWPEIEFHIERTIKGRTRGDRVVLMTPSTAGVNCRGFDFVVGRDYLVFASARDSETGRPLTYGVNSCGGTASLTEDEGQRRLRDILRLAR